MDLLLKRLALTLQANEANLTIKYENNNKKHQRKASLSRDIHLYQHVEKSSKSHKYIDMQREVHSRRKKKGRVELHTGSIL